MYTLYMKKGEKTLVTKKDNDFEMLARLMQDGFSRVEEGFKGVDRKFDLIDKKFEHVDSQLFAIHHELKEHGHRLDRIERKQIGTLASLDEAVYRHEFKTLSNRVTALEKKSSNK